MKKLLRITLVCAIMGINILGTVKAQDKKYSGYAKVTTVASLRIIEQNTTSRIQELDSLILAKQIELKALQKEKNKKNRELKIVSSLIKAYK